MMDRYRVAGCALVILSAAVTIAIVRAIVR